MLSLVALALGLCTNASQAGDTIPPDVWAINFPTGVDNAFGQCTLPMVGLFIGDGGKIQFTVVTIDGAAVEDCGKGEKTAALLDFYAKTKDSMTLNELYAFRGKFKEAAVYGDDTHSKLSKSPPPKLDEKKYVPGHSYITSDGGRLIVERLYYGTFCNPVFRSRLRRVEPDGKTSKTLYPMVLIPEKVIKYSFQKQCAPISAAENRFAAFEKVVEGFDLALTSLGNGSYLAWSPDMASAVRFDEHLNSPGLSESSVYWLEEAELQKLLGPEPLETPRNPLQVQRLLAKIISQRVVANPPK
ncbi:MAG: hypothetical protein ACYC1L_04350 [Alphaproteobacteria bacterium]